MTVYHDPIVAGLVREKRARLRRGVKPAEVERWYSADGDRARRLIEDRAGLMSEVMYVAAWCHRAKWAFSRPEDPAEDERMGLGEQREAMREAFDTLHEIGDYLLREVERSMTGKVLDEEADDDHGDDAAG